MASKKLKICAGICIPTVAMATAVGISAIVISLNKDHNDPALKKDFTVTFDAGEGQFAPGQKHNTEVYAGTHFDEVDQPVVQMPNKLFAGWIDENDKPVYGRQTVNRNMKLKASYKSATGEYLTVTFEPELEDTYIQGNVRFAINKGYFFFMVNRPTVKHEGKHFKNWIYKTGSKAGEVVKENDVLTEDIILVPELTETVGLTWNGNGATRTRGAEKTYVETGTKFKNINQPSFEFGTKMFQGWYKDSGCTQAWTLEETLQADSTAYAKWEDAPSEYYCNVSYMQKPGTEVVPSFAPANTQVILKTSPWSVIFKPTVSTASGDYVVDHWEYSTDGTSNWTTITNETVFNYDQIYICPVLIPNVENIYISGATNLLTESSTTLSAFVLGCTTQTVTWEVYDDATCEGAPSTIATISSAGVLSAKFVSTENKKVYVQATSTVDTTKKSLPFEVDITLPYFNSDKIWYNNGFNWFWFTQETLTTLSTDSYVTHKLADESTTRINKADGFTNKIYIGRNIKSIPDNFMCGFTGFNAIIDFSATYDSEGVLLNSGNNVTSIQDSFLEECHAFNRTIDLSHISYIGNDFLYGCYQFNNGATMPEHVYPLDLSTNTVLTTIGDNFLGNCYHFNQEIQLPASNALTNIGQFFLFNCLRFNKPLNIPSTVTTINPFFMLNCCSFANTITVNCDVNNTFKGNKSQICSIASTWDDPQTVSTEAYVAEIYNTGFTVAGSGTTDFITMFGTMGSDAKHIWRRVLN